MNNLPIRITSPSYLGRLEVVGRHLVFGPSKMSKSTTASDGRQSPSNKPVTAGIIVIGDEILKGQTVDSNSHFLTKKLFSFGVKVKKVSVIPDDLDTISEEVSRFSKSYTHVLTSGGIGPTHDDMTFEGVAKAFGSETEFHPHIVQLITDWFKTSDLNSPEMKMAKIPKNAKLNFFIDPKTQQQSKYPLVSVENVYIFPGVPSLLEKAFDNLQSLFRNPKVHFYTSEMFINATEVNIAKVVSSVADKYKDTLTLGSYPDLFNSYYKVKLSLESTEASTLKNAQQELTDLMPKDSIVLFEKSPIEHSHVHVYDLIEKRGDDLADKVKDAVASLEEALDRYSLDEICIGYNGGKDCTVILHLFHAVVKKKYPDFKGKLQALYIRSRCPFPEVEKFVQLTRDKYNLEMIHYDGRIKECLSVLAEKHPHMKAVIMGTRMTDPYSDKLTTFAMTDSDWPQFMRVNPVLTWHYAHVWGFLRSLYLPYCTLYDRGYTSLGSINNTHPNPLLQYVDKRGVLSYRPAYLLQDGSKERDGRNP